MSTLGNDSDLISDMADKTFYGFKIDVATGNLEVHVIDDGTMTVNLDDNEITDQGTYIHHIWSKQMLGFDFNESNGHLHLEIV